MYAIIEVAGKQFKVSKDDKIYVPLLDHKVDASIEIDDVLLVSNDGDIQVGTPTVAGASVTATVLDHVKADKVLVYKKKRRKRFKVKRGHRQQYTQLQVNDLVLGGEKKKPASKKKDEEAPAKAADKAASSKKETKAPAEKAGKAASSKKETKAPAEKAGKATSKKKETETAGKTASKKKEVSKAPAKATGKAASKKKEESKTPAKAASKKKEDDDSGNEK